MNRVIALLVCLLAVNQGFCQSTSLTLTDVSASATTAGEVWYLDITRNGQAFVRFYSTRAAGNMAGDFIVNQEHLAKIQAVAKENGFGDLKEKLRPEVM